MKKPLHYPLLLVNRMITVVYNDHIHTLQQLLSASIISFGKKKRESMCVRSSTSSSDMYDIDLREGSCTCMGTGTISYAQIMPSIKEEKEKVVCQIL